MAWTYGYRTAQLELHELINRLASDLKSLIADKIAPKRPVVRQLRPQDIGLDKPEWEVRIPAGSTTVTAYSFTVPERKAIAIFGIYRDNAIVKELRIKAGAKDVAVIPLQELDVIVNSGEYYNVKFLTGEDILKIPERTTITIIATVYPAPTSDVTVRLGLLGIIAEAEGDTISL